MARSKLLRASLLLFSLQTLTKAQSEAPSPSVVTVDIGGTPTTFRDIFTIPASADNGANLLPTSQDPEAVDAQSVCPGYQASQAKKSEHGLTAVLKLAGEPCNAYGNDIEVLNLKVEYQSANRLSVNISPANIVRVRAVMRFSSLV